MNDVTDWKVKIIQAIHEERYSLGGPAGDTPLSRMSDKLRRLPREEHEALAATFVDLVCDPSPEDFSAADYWNGISFLAYDLGSARNDPALKNAFRSRVFGAKALDDDVRVFALRGYCETGGHLYPAELESLDSIRKLHPLDWLNAAVLSSEFELASNNAKQMLQKGKLEIGIFILGLDSWADKWDRRVSFSRLVKEFRDYVPAGPGREKLDRWIARRGIVELEGNMQLEAGLRLVVIKPAVTVNSKKPIKESGKRLASASRSYRRSVEPQRLRA